MAWKTLFCKVIDLYIFRIQQRQRISALPLLYYVDQICCQALTPGWGVVISMNKVHALSADNSASLDRSALTSIIFANFSISSPTVIILVLVASPLAM